MTNDYDNVTKMVVKHSQLTHLPCGCQAISPVGSRKWLLYEKDLVCHIHDQDEAVNDTDRNVEGWEGYKGMY